MSLTLGSGPFGQRPGGTFSFPPPQGGMLYLERSPRWVRAILAGQTVVDSRRAWVLHESGTLPHYYFPREDLLAELVPEGRAPGSRLRGEVERYAIRAGGELAPDAAWSHPAPPPGAPEGLAELVGVAWDAMDEWWEEAERIVVHMRDPYHRVDVLDTSRHVVVAAGGEVLAETRRAKVLFETSLPPRWYIPPEDVRMDLLEPMDLTSACAYKGTARYWSARTPEGIVPALVWCYDRPNREVAPIRGLCCFFNERTDMALDGEPQRRPVTPWSARDWYLLPPP